MAIRVYKTGPNVDLSIEEYASLRRIEAIEEVKAIPVGERRLVMALNFIPVIVTRTGPEEVTFNLVNWADETSQLTMHQLFSASK